MDLSVGLPYSPQTRSNPEGDPGSFIPLTDKKLVDACVGGEWDREGDGVGVRRAQVDAEPASRAGLQLH